MKRQLDRLKGKRLVTGDPNLMTKDEICINATPNGVEVKEIGTDGSIKDIANGGGGGGDSIFSEAYIKFKKEDYKDSALGIAESNLEMVFIADGKKSLTTSILISFGGEPTPYGRYRFPINVAGYIINNLEDIKNLSSHFINFDEEIEEITADEFYNFLNN